MPRSIRKGPFVDTHLANKVVEANAKKIKASNKNLVTKIYGFT